MPAKKALATKPSRTHKGNKASKKQTLLSKVKSLMAGNISSTPDLLDELTSVIRKGFNAHACSIYTVRNNKDLVLTATSGLNKNAIGVTKLPVDQGFIGYVIAQKKPLSVSSLAKHPKFILKAETGEDEYLGGCVSVPLMWDNQAIGTLSLQSKTHRKFSSDAVETLETIAMVIANIIHNTLDTELNQTQIAPESHILSGVPIHYGLAEGKAYIHQPGLDQPLVRSSNPQREESRLNQGLIDLTREIDKLVQTEQKKKTKTSASDATSIRDILSTFQVFLNDKGWLSKIRTHIKSGLKAESATQKTLEDIENRLSNSSDPYLKDRFWDVKDLSSRLIKTLRGHSKRTNDIPKGGIIVVAESLGPADLLHYQQFDLRCIVLESGLQTAHVAILARSMNLPIIGRVNHVSTVVHTGDALLMDGREGNIIQQPNGLDKQKFADRVAKQKQVQDQARKFESKKAITADGIKISLHLNAGLITDLENSNHMDIDGIGLLRTEIPFMMQDNFPDVDYQTNLYREFISRMGTRPVKIRTLDIGGDKLLPYFDHVPEDNPMMGWRSIRIGLDRPALLRKQIRAIIRAAQGGRVDIMFPMITEVDEFIRAKALVEKELKREEDLGHLTPLDIKYGTMLEVPMLIWRLDQLLPLVDFLSIGTNDLFQFMFATDRGNPYTANHFDVLSPAFLSILKHIYQKASSEHVPVSICGEMASRPLEFLALIGLGYTDFSMGRGTIGSTKKLIRNIDTKHIQNYLSYLLKSSKRSIRNNLQTYANDKQLQI